MDSAVQALLGRNSTAYSQIELMHAFTLFADPHGSHGFISHKELKSALVKYSRDKLSSSDVDMLLANSVTTLQDSVDYQAIISRTKKFFGLITPKGCSTHCRHCYCAEDQFTFLPLYLVAARSYALAASISDEKVPR
ncbi:MAG: hypothetical protein FRX49_05612 [Trebouxia sp. A1-2]|nr:MAG: hypothetical protein FRX49_05612 [Trebouxia sp. A1-2]